MAQLGSMWLSCCISLILTSVFHICGCVYGNRSYRTGKIQMKTKVFWAEKYDQMYFGHIQFQYG